MREISLQEITLLRRGKGASGTGGMGESINWGSEMHKVSMAQNEGHSNFSDHVTDAKRTTIERPLKETGAAYSLPETSFRKEKPRRAKCSCGWRSPRPTIAEQLLVSLSNSSAVKNRGTLSTDYPPGLGRERVRLSEVLDQRSHEFLAPAGFGIVSAVSLASSIPRPVGPRNCSRLAHGKC